MWGLCSFSSLCLQCSFPRSYMAVPSLPCEQSLRGLLCEPNLKEHSNSCSQHAWSPSLPYFPQNGDVVLHIYPCTCLFCISLIDSQLHEAQNSVVLTTEFLVPGNISRSSERFVKRQNFSTISSLIVLRVTILFENTKIVACSTFSLTALTQTIFDILYGWSIHAM